MSSECLPHSCQVRNQGPRGLLSTASTSLSGLRTLPGHPQQARNPARGHGCAPSQGRQCRFPRTLVSSKGWPGRGRRWVLAAAQEVPRREASVRYSFGYQSDEGDVSENPVGISCGHLNTKNSLQPQSPLPPKNVPVKSDRSISENPLEPVGLGAGAQGLLRSRLGSIALDRGAGCGEGPPSLGPGTVSRS